MPPKRQFDVNPQFFRLPALIESGPHTYTEVSKTTPVVSNVGNSRSLVMEILKAIVSLTPHGFEATDENSIAVHIADRTSAVILGWDQPGVIFRDTNHCQVIGAGIEGGTQGNSLIVLDLTDSNGNGVLFGGPTIFMGILGDVTGAAAGEAKAALLFRLKEVSAGEYAQSLQFG